MKWHHGGDWADFQQQYGRLPLDFSANVSPLGLPNGVQEAVQGALEQCGRYPDPFCRELTRSIGETVGVPDRWILCGNGSADLIFRVVQARKPVSALITAPTFSEYSAALRTVGSRILEWNLTSENGFHLSEQFLGLITEKLDMVFLCEPNNPTGVTTDPELLKGILQRCEQCNILLVVDECFNGLLDHPEAHSLLPRVNDSSHLIILNAFTKSYGMAGLRLGYAVSSDKTLLDAMRKSGPPWPVSVPAQAAGTAALRDTTYPLRLRKLISLQRTYLKQELEQCGAQNVQGEANYLFFFHDDVNLADKLKERNILIRPCSNFHGLGEGWFRTAVRTKEENQRLIFEIRQVVEP